MFYGVDETHEIVNNGPREFHRDAKVERFISIEVKATANGLRPRSLSIFAVAFERYYVRPTRSGRCYRINRTSTLITRRDGSVTNRDTGASHNGVET